MRCMWVTFGVGGGKGEVVVVVGGGGLVWSRKGGKVLGISHFSGPQVHVSLGATEVQSDFWKN